MTCARSPSGAPSSRRRPNANALGTMNASTLRDQPPLPERQRRAVHEAFGHRAAAAQSHAGERVPAVAAGAVGPAGEAGADRAHEPVVVQVQHDPRAGLARRLQRPPAERRMHVVRVHDAGALAPHRGGHRVRLQAAAEQPERSARRAQVPRVALEHRRLLAELGPDQPREVLDRALLAAGHAVTVVQEEDQRPSRRSSRPPQTTAAWKSGGISRRCQRERTCLSVNRVIEAVMCSSREATTPPSCRTRTVGR